MSLTQGLLELVALFNRQKTDLPDGLLHKDCVFRLNGRAFHEHLGRPVSDPIVRLVGCGAAGYRFILAALRHALQEPRLALHDDTLAVSGDSGRVLRARGTLSGTLRGSNRPLVSECGLDMIADPHGRVTEIAATLGDADMELLLAARRRT